MTKVPDDVRLDLRERARYFAELTDVGVPRVAMGMDLLLSSAYCRISGKMMST